MMRCTVQARGHMLADIEIVWDSLRWQFEGIAIDVSVDLDIVTRGYVPRTIEFSVPIGDTFTRWVSGHAWESIGVTVRVNGEIYSTSPVVGMSTSGVGGNGNVMTTIRVADQPAEESPVPPLTDVTLRTVDQQATRNALAAAVKAKNIAQARTPNNNDFSDSGGKDISAVPAELGSAWTGPGNVYALAVQGLAMPLPFGQPGKDSTPAYRILQIDSAQRRLLVAAFPMKGTVSVQKAPFTTWYVYTVQTYTLAGREVSIIQIPTYPGIPDDESYDETSSFYVAFDGTAEGLPGGAADVCEWLLDHTDGVRCDYASWASVRARLAPYTFDTCLDQTGDAWQILTGDVLPLLPIQLIPTPYGIGAVWVELDPARAKFRKRAAYRSSLDSAGDASVRFTTTQPVTAAIVGFAPIATSSGYAGSVLADATTIDVARRLASQVRGKTKRLDTPWVRDRSVAQLIANNLVRSGCLRYAPIEGQADPAMHGDEGSQPLHVADVVDLYNDDGQIEASGIILSERRTADDLRFTVGILQQ